MRRRLIYRTGRYRRRGLDKSSQRPIGLKSILINKERQLEFWHETARVLQVVMEMTWVSLYIFALTGGNSGFLAWRVFGIFAGMAIFSYITARLTVDRINNKKVMRIVFLGWSLIGTWLVVNFMLYPTRFRNPLEMIQDIWHLLTGQIVFPAHIWIIFTTLVIIWRTALLSNYRVDMTGVQSSFQFGLAMLLVYGIFGINPRLPSAIPQIIFYIATGLCALGCTRLVSLSGSTGGTPIPNNKVWLGMILAGTLLLILLIIGINALILSGQVVIKEVLIYAAAIFMTVIILPLTLVLLGITYLISIPFGLIMQTIIPIFKKLRMDLGIQSGNIPPIELLNRTINTSPEIAISLTLFILLAIAASIGLANRARRKHIFHDEESDLESTGWWDRQKDWLKSKWKATLDDLVELSKLKNVQKAWSAARIRWVYARLMDLAGQLNSPRQSAVTPLEFLPIISQVLPETAPELKLVTDAYIQVRYGEIPEQESEVGQVLAAWKTIREKAQPTVNKIRRERNSIQHDHLQ